LLIPCSSLGKDPIPETTTDNGEHDKAEEENEKERDQGRKVWIEIGQRRFRRGSIGRGRDDALDADLLVVRRQVVVVGVDGEENLFRRDDLVSFRFDGVDEDVGHVAPEAVLVADVVSGGRIDISFDPDSVTLAINSSLAYLFFRLNFYFAFLYINMFFKSKSKNLKSFQLLKNKNA
jgi:hypothetical protein